MKRHIFAAALLVSLASSPAHAETLDNQSVLTLVSAGLGDEAIIAKIKTSATKFDTSMDALIKLKRSGVSSPVIAAMVEASSAGPTSTNAAGSPDSPDPLVPHPSGVYLLDNSSESSRMMSIDPSTSNQTKTGGFLGYALTGGIASMSFKTVVPNPQAKTVSKVVRPVFYFYFDQSNRSLSNGGSNAIWMSGAVTSPNEFSLVRFDVKKDHREAKVGKFNIAGAKSGVMDKDRIPFTYTLVMPGVYKVVPDADLKPGEYGFIYSASTGGGGLGGAGVGAMTAKIFDFSIPLSSKAS